MKHFLYSSLTMLLFSLSAAAQFQYLSPMPGAKMISPHHQIIIRKGGLIEPSFIHQDLFSIRGEKSGLLEFDIVLANDGKTILLKPLRPFAFDEEIFVTIRPGLQSSGEFEVDGFTFSFFTHREYSPAEQQSFREAKKILLDKEIAQNVQMEEPLADTRDFEDMFDITVNTNPSPGNIFYDVKSALLFPTEFTGYHCITSDGDSVFSRYIDHPWGFQQQETGYFGVFNGNEGRYETMDSNFNIIDKLYPANGYDPDVHEFLVTSDGHKFIIVEEFQVIDMTVYDPDYSENATVLGTLIQEFDNDHNLVFEWRSLDHVEVIEALHVNLAFTLIDYMHTNSVDIEQDGHIIASHRHLDQVTKIDRNTGNFIWRLGGLNNEFTFINDAEAFTYQHDARRIANGNLTLFDNGNYHNPSRSYAKEYHLDEVSKTATLVWSYSHPDTSGGYYYYYAMGNMQRLSNGNTFINWGLRGFSSYPSMTEVTPDGTIVWELQLNGGFGNLISYRAHKYEWDPCARPTFKKMEAKNITNNSAKLKWAEVANALEYHVQYRIHNDATWKEKVVDAPKHNVNIHGLEPGTKYDWRIATWCTANGSKASGYSALKKFTTLTGKTLLTPEEEIPSVIIYPNPVSDVLTIDSRKTELNEIRLLTVMGQEIQRVSVSNDGIQQLSLEHLPSGNYIVELFTPHGRYTEKLIVD